MGDYEGEAIDEDIIEVALVQEAVDEEIIAEVEDTLGAAYADAAAVLLAAELIDATDVDDVVAVITEVWAADDE